MSMQGALIAIDRVVSSRASLQYELAEDLDVDAAECADELVEELIGRGTVSVLFGDSNTGKTFLAIDLGCAIARQTSWMGRRVEPGMVVYLATESPASVRSRLRAYQKYHGCRVSNFVVVTTPVNLFRSSADTDAVIDLIRDLERDYDMKCELIIGDTLARMAAGANENSGDDMTIVLAHIDRIRSTVQASLLLIHHSGKDAAKGMRGWSGIRAAVDTELRVGVSALGIGAIEVTKQRDLPGMGARIHYQLKVVSMGRGKWGKALTSCIVEAASALPQAPRLARLGDTQKAVLGVLREAGGELSSSSICDLLNATEAKRKSIFNAIDRLRVLKLVHVTAGRVRVAENLEGA